MPYTVLANSYWVSFQDAVQFQDHTINDTDYNCHITVVELV